MLRKSLARFSHRFTGNVRRDLHVSANPLCRAIKDNTECANADSMNRPPRILITGKYTHFHSSSRRNCDSDDQKTPFSSFLHFTFFQEIFHIFEKSVSLNFVRGIRKITACGSKSDEIGPSEVTQYVMIVVQQNLRILGRLNMFFNIETLSLLACHHRVYSQYSLLIFFLQC